MIGLKLVRLDASVSRTDGGMMSNRFWLTEGQMERLRPFFLTSHGKARVCDLCFLSCIIFINRDGGQWCDSPREYGPPKILNNRWKGWSDIRPLAQLMLGPARESGGEKVVMIDAT